MKTDTQLKDDVSSELEWDPAINANGIGVIVQNGVVTLTGHLNTFAERHAVERAVHRVAGVRGIALELDVKLGNENQRTDTEIAQVAISALRWNSLVPEDRVMVELDKGWVTLTGEVDWAYQASSAEQCVRTLKGVRGIFNRITVKPRVKAENVGAQITAALTRQATREAKHIKVDVDGGIVTLEGKVHSMAEHDAAIGSAYSAAGVSLVIDKLEVSV